MFNIADQLTFRVHGGSDHHGGGVAGGMETLLTWIEKLITQDPAETFSEILPGLASIPNIHPLLVHFPIALLTLFFLVDLIGALFKSDEIRRTAGWFLYTGTLGALLAVAAGLQAASTVPHDFIVHEIMMRHRNYGVTVASLAVLLSLWRFLAHGRFNTVGNILHLGLAAATCIIMALGADLGGLMVFRYGVAVSVEAPSMPSPSPQDHGHNHGHTHNHNHDHGHSH